jgi:DNA recombination protein RmuC
MEPGGLMSLETLLILSTVFLGIVGVLVVVLLLRGYKERLLQASRFASLEKNQERAERLLKEEIAKNREEATSNAKQGREEMSQSIKSFSDSFLSRMTDISTLQKNQLETFANQLSVLTQTNEQRLDKMRSTVEERLKLLQDENSQRLEQMRATVDEKLHETLEKRLGDSFKLVSERLEQVHKGLGEMQTLAAGVGDLKRVLTNVKTRGTWGEVQLGTLLDEIFTNEQYAKNVATKKGSSERVEFAIKFPGRDEANGHEIWLPIDAKFPLEDYERLIEAQEKGDLPLAEEATKKLETRIKKSAKEIKEKYLDPPHTTDFGIMFLPTEGLYAEVIRRPGLMDFLRRESRVEITGPTTLSAFLNSLQMGFRTLAIEKRSSEVWALLGAVKTEFGKFGMILEKTQKKLQEASNTIENAAKKSRTIERKLKSVQELPSPEAVNLIGEIEE